MIHPTDATVLGSPVSSKRLALPLIWMARLDNDSANVIGLLLGARPSESNGGSGIISDLQAAAAETSRPPEWELTPSPPLCTEEHSSPVEGSPVEDSLAEDEDHLQALVKRAAAATAAARHAKMLADEAFAELESARRERDQIESDLREGALEGQTQSDAAQSPILTDHGNVQEASHSPQRPCTSDGDDDEPRIVELCEPRLHGCPPVADEAQESKSPWETAAAPCASSSRSEIPSISQAPASSTPFAFWIGCGVRVEGLRQRSELNGCLGQIVDYSAGRYGVRILGRSDRRGNPLGVRLLPMNMVPGVLPEDAFSISASTSSVAEAGASGPLSSATTDGRKEIRMRAQHLDMGEAAKPVQSEPSAKRSKSPQTYSKHAGELTEDELRHAAELDASRRRSAAEGAKAAEAIALQYAKAVSEEVKTRNTELAAVEPELPLDKPQRKKAEPCNINKPMQEMRYRPPQDTPQEATTKDAAHGASHPNGLTGKDALDADMGTLFGEGQSGTSGFVPVRSTEGFVVGDRVFVHGLEYHRELNGTAGTITGLSGGRFQVRLMGRRERSGAHVILSLPPENIRGRSQDGLSLDALPHPRDAAHVTSEASSKATGNDAQLIADSSSIIETDELGHAKHEELGVDDDQAAEAIEKSGQVSASEKAREAMRVAAAYARSVQSPREVERAANEAKAAAIIASNVARAERREQVESEGSKNSSHSESEQTGSSADEEESVGRNDEPWWGDALRGDDVYIADTDRTEAVDRWKGWEFDDLGRAHKRPGRTEPLTADVPLDTFDGAADEPEIETTTDEPEIDTTTDEPEIEELMHDIVHEAR